MTESNRHPRSAQPHRPGTGSVPVLFSLRNVQPSIVGGIANTRKSSDAIPSITTEKSNAAIESATIPSPVLPASTLASTPLTGKSNRAYNVVVGILVIALCLLVIRNTQSSNNATNTPIASSPANGQAGLKIEAPATATSTPIASTNTSTSSSSLAKVDPFPSISTPQLTSTSPPQLAPPQLATPLVAEQKMPESKPVVLEGFGTPTQAPSTDAVASLDLEGTPSTDESKDPISLKGEGNLASAEQNMVQAKPSLLLPSAKAETLSTPNTPLSFPETRLAMNPSVGSSNPPSSVESTSPNNTAPKPAESFPSQMDTGSPNLTTRELIDIRNRVIQPAPATSFNGQAFPRTSVEPGFQATPISNTTVVGEGNMLPSGANPYQAIPRSNSAGAYQPLPPDSTMLSGRSYPPLPQENPALKIPPYEQGPTIATQSSQSIRQPLSNSSNRYTTTLAPQVPYTPIPYTPTAPTQSGNSFGYPPGK